MITSVFVVLPIFTKCFFFDPLRVRRSSSRDLYLLWSSLEAIVSGAKTCLRLIRMSLRWLNSRFSREELHFHWLIKKGPLVLGKYSLPGEIQSTDNVRGTRMKTYHNQNKVRYPNPVRVGLNLIWLCSAVKSVVGENFYSICPLPLWALLDQLFDIWVLLLNNKTLDP